MRLSLPALAAAAVIALVQPATAQQPPVTAPDLYPSRNVFWTPIEGLRGLTWTVVCFQQGTKVIDIQGIDRIQELRIDGVLRQLQLGRPTGHTVVVSLGEGAICAYAQP